VEFYHLRLLRIESDGRFAQASSLQEQIYRLRRALHANQPPGFIGHTDDEKTADRIGKPTDSFCQLCCTRRCHLESRSRRFSTLNERLQGFYIHVSKPPL
jgi:hypothetical protein